MQFLDRKFFLFFSVLFANFDKKELTEILKSGKNPNEKKEQIISIILKNESEQLLKNPFYIEDEKQNLNTSLDSINRLTERLFGFYMFITKSLPKYLPSVWRDQMNHFNSDKVESFDNWLTLLSNEKIFDVFESVLCYCHESACFAYSIYNHSPIYHLNGFSPSTNLPVFKALFMGLTIGMQIDRDNLRISGNAVKLLCMFLPTNHVWAYKAARVPLIPQELPAGFFDVPNIDGVTTSAICYDAVFAKIEANSAANVKMPTHFYRMPEEYDIDDSFDFVPTEKLGHSDVIDKSPMIFLNLARKKIIEESHRKNLIFQARQLFLNNQHINLFGKDNLRHYSSRSQYYWSDIFCGAKKLLTSQKYSPFFAKQYNHYDSFQPEQSHYERQESHKKTYKDYYLNALIAWCLKSLECSNETEEDCIRFLKCIKSILNTKKNYPARYLIVYLSAIRPIAGNVQAGEQYVIFFSTKGSQIIN